MKTPEDQLKIKVKCEIEIDIEPNGAVSCYRVAVVEKDGYSLVYGGIGCGAGGVTPLDDRYYKVFEYALNAMKRLKEESPSLLKRDLSGETGWTGVTG